MALYQQGKYAEAVPLAKRMLVLEETSLGPDDPEVASTAREVGIRLYNQGLFAEAEPFYKHALAIREKVLGPDHLDVAALLHELADNEFRQNLYAGAEPLYQHALMIQEKMLGPDDPQIASTVFDLALLYYVQDRFSDAEPFATRALAIEKKGLGSDDPRLETYLNALSDIFIQQRRFAETEPLLKEQLRLKEKALGPDDPGVAAAVFTLAHLDLLLKRPDDAKPLLARGLALQEKVLGPTDPKDITMAGDLAGSFMGQGRYKDAEALLRPLLALKEKDLRPHHLEVASALIRLGDALFFQRRYVDAEALYRRAVAIREERLGQDSPEVASALMSLAVDLSRQAKRSDAEPLYKRALAIREKAPGPDHLDIAVTLIDLANDDYQQARYLEAEPLYKRALAIREKVLGPNHLDVAAALLDLAENDARQMRFTEAEPLYKRALEIREKALGSSSLELVVPLLKLAEAYREQGRYNEALAVAERPLAIQKAAKANDRQYPELLREIGQIESDRGHFAQAEESYKQALDISNVLYGPNKPKVADAMLELGQLYAANGRSAEAERLFRQALPIYERHLDSHGHEAAETMNSLALLFISQGQRLDDAEALLQRAISLPDSPRNTAAYVNNLAMVYRAQGRLPDAAALYEKALDTTRRALGPDHPSVVTLLNNLALVKVDEHRFSDAEDLLLKVRAARERLLGPDHPLLASTLSNLAYVYAVEGRFDEAAQLYKQALAIDEKVLGPAHPDLHKVLTNLAELYFRQRKYADALVFARKMIESRGAAPNSIVLPILAAAQATNLISAHDAINDSLNVIQRLSQTAAGDALNSLSVRLSAGTDRLAQIVRSDQDLAAEGARLDEALLGEALKMPTQRNQAAVDQTTEKIAKIAGQRHDLEARLSRDFPDYAALSHPQPIDVKDVEARLAQDEAVVVIDLRARSYAWIITRDQARWTELGTTPEQVSKTVEQLRELITSGHPFDPKLSYALYRQLLGPVEASLHGKTRLSFVLNGALTSLPPQLLVTKDPAGKAMKDIDWLIRTYAVTVLPSVDSLKILRSTSVVASAEKPLIGFADPVFDARLARDNPQVVASASVSRGQVAELDDLRDLERLPESASEVRKVAASVGASSDEIFLGAAVNETRVKAVKLDRYRIVYFATHGLLAGEVAKFAKIKAEPALVLSLPEHPTEADDGLLTASEIAQLKLNADWVVLSACNTAAGNAPGAEALSGLARAFFYAGGRSLLVSNWKVDSASAVALMTGTFAAIATDPTLSHGEALQKAMLAMIADEHHPEWADPAYWAPFIVVGEPAKPNGIPTPPALSHAKSNQEPG